MSDDKFSRQVTMQCPTCGGTQFAFENKAGPFRCVGCDRTFQREELMRENGHRIDDELEAMKGEVVKDLRDRLRKSLSGSKHFTIK
jgi:uncharacterized Zn finger protein (UPF0148 family)